LIGRSGINKNPHFNLLEEKMSSNFKPLGQNWLSGIVFMIFLIAGPITALSQSDDPVPFAIEIGEFDSALLGDNVSIPVTKTAGSQPIYGFDFLIGYDIFALTLLDATPGELYDDPGDYEWEYFTYRYTWNGNCGSGCPSGLVRAVGVADVNDGDNYPLETMVPDGMVLFNLNFEITNDQTFEGLFIPIRFYWMDCGDNAISYEDSTTLELGLSRMVYDYDGSNITDTLAGFPAYYGSPVDCFSGPNIPERFIDFTNGGVNIQSSGLIYVHWGNVAEFDVPAVDPDTTNGCDMLTYSMLQGPATAAIDSVTGHFTWLTTGDDVCYHMVVIEIADDCGATSEYAMNICVQNDPPQATDNPNDTIYAGWGIVLSQQVEAFDPDNDPDNLSYRIISFSGPLWWGSGMQIDSNTGIWSWDIGEHWGYLGDFVLRIEISDGADICGGCSNENADTAYYNIHVIGQAVTIEVVHNQLQGQYAEVSVSLDSAYMPDTLITDLIGGFDFLIAYDASILTVMSVVPGSLIDNDKFEYFTYRLGPPGGCPDGCPSGMLRVVGIREMNDGIINDYHLTSPGELVKLNFYVSSNPMYAGQFTPIQFYWIDCGDNAIVVESGDWLFLGSKIYDYAGIELNDSDGIFGYYGPEQYCYDTVYQSNETFKNAPMGSIIFRNGGIDIRPTDVVEDRGDVNVNGIPYEIADYVVFANYFLYGPVAFTINFEAQKAATDVNADEVTLTIEDLVYLVRVMEGVLLPIPSTPNGPIDSFDGDLYLTETDSSIIISSDFADSVGGLYMVFNAPGIQSDSDYVINVFPEIAHMGVGHNGQNDKLNILICGISSGPPLYDSAAIDSGFIDLFEIIYTGEKPQLDLASAAGFLGEYVNLTIYDLPDVPPVFNPYSANMVNDFYGGFEYQFSAYYPFKSSTPIEYEIISGPGDIDPETGLYRFAPLCVEIGMTTYTLEICASNLLNPCSQADSTQMAIVELSIAYEPPMVGDANGNGDIDIQDVIFLIAYKYLGGGEPIPSYEVADVNADGTVNIFDIVYLLCYLFMDGPEPLCP